MSADDPTLPKPGDLLAGKYRVQRVLGKGGMGIVYAAHHEILAQRVAVKLLLSDIAQSPDAVTRFMNEARAAARIQSDHVARVMDVGTLDAPGGGPGRPFMVMEFLEGADLAGVLEARGQLPLGEAVDHVLQALEALAQAHLLGIVHRDLKPANLFLTQRVDGNVQVKVLDFGISKASNPLAGAAVTNTKSMLGSPYYMSPEQLRSAKSVDARTDIWSLGVILHELLSGSPPFLGETLGELFVAIIERDPPSLCAVRPDVPPSFEAVVHRCLRRNPDERYGNAAELASALLPFATPRGAMSAQRVLSAMPVRPSQPVPAAAAPSGFPAATMAGTGGAWEGARPPLKRSSGAAWILAAGAAVVLLGAGAFGVRAVMVRSATAPPRTSTAHVAADPPSASPIPDPTTARTEAVALMPLPTASDRSPRVGAGSGVVADAGRASGVPLPPHPSTTAAPSQRPAPSGTTTAPVKKPNCDPNYTLDSEGNKHFKPECF